MKLLRFTFKIILTNYFGKVIFENKFYSLKTQFTAFLACYCSYYVQKGDRSLSILETTLCIVLAQSSKISAPLFSIILA